MKALEGTEALRNFIFNPEYKLKKVEVGVYNYSNQQIISAALLQKFRGLKNQILAIADCLH